jgi:hypothetical protein
MTLTLISQPQYKIERKGFEDLIYTESSKEAFIWPKAVKFAADRNSVLQSLREAAALRIEANGQDDADRYQTTRTGAVYFVKNGTAYVAFDDAPDPAQNIVIAHVQEGYDANKAGKEFLVPFKDKQLKDLLIRAEQADRIQKLPKSHLELALSDYVTNGVVQSLFGDVAEPYAQFLNEKSFKKGYVWLLNPDQVGKETEGKSAIVRPVGLGGVVYYDVDGVDADYCFNLNGRARGVRPAQKISTRQEPHRVSTRNH